MKRLSFPKPLAVLAFAGLANACGGGSSAQGSGGGFSSLRCDTINQGGAETVATVDPGCADCTVADEANAADNSIKTFATLDAPNAQQGQGVAIRSTAQSGVVYAAGRKVSAFVRYSGTELEGVGAEAVVTLRTYISGGLQEQQSHGSSACTANCALTRQDLGIGGDQTQPGAFMWFTATKVFDAIEIHYSAPGLHTEAADLKVYGLCSDGAVGS